MVAALHRPVKEQEAEIRELKRQVEVTCGLLSQQTTSVNTENRKGP